MARKPTLGTRYSRIRTVLKNYLDEKKIYDPADELLIDEILFCIKISDEAKEDIKTRGLQINVVKNPEKDPYYQQNPSVGLYLQTSKNLGNLLTKLGITVQERSRGGLTNDGPDPLAELMGGNLFTPHKKPA